MWITPKTDWKKDDDFSLEGDYSRIKGNIWHLQALAKYLYLPFYPQQQMSVYFFYDFPYAGFFNDVEENLLLLYTNSYQRSTYFIRLFKANDFVWNWRDLNRIESISAQLFADFAVQAQTRPKLKLYLGVQQFV